MGEVQCGTPLVSCLDLSTVHFLEVSSYTVVSIRSLVLVHISEVVRFSEVRYEIFLCIYNTPILISLHVYNYND